MLILTEQDVKAILDYNTSKIVNWAREAFLMDQSNILMPEKSTQLFDSENKDRINCMPASLLSQKVSGVKLISVFPTNQFSGYPNVQGTITLNEINSGIPIAFMGAAYLTAVRTAATGALASIYLALSNVRSIGFIGTGEQARMHFKFLKSLHRHLDTCYLSSNDEYSIYGFIECFQKETPEVQFINCHSDFDDAVCNADIIVTATSAQGKLLKEQAIKKDGAFYIHVGGIEDENDVAFKASKIVCDQWESVKHREQTLSVMYHQGLLTDHDIYGDLPEIIRGEKPGRENETEFIYFNSVGLAYIDIYFANKVYQYAVEHGIGSQISM